MPRDRYEPIKLNQTNRYAGYQFHARVRVDGMGASDAFRYLVLSVYHWIRSRVPEEDRGARELSVPEAEEYASVSAEDFLPYHFSVGYALDITPLVEEGIWALRLKEPDIGTDERPSVSGRFFTTRVGLRLNDKGYTELGIRIDVTDPASAEKEVDFAFRPGFVRSLAIQPSVSFEQVREVGYGCPLRVATPEEYKKFLFFLDNEENQLPLVVFTHYRPGEKKPVSVSMEDFLKGHQIPSFLQSPGFGMTGAKKDDLMSPASVSGMPSLRPGVVVTKELVVKASAVSASAAPVASPSVPVADPVLMHDADAFARSAFGYALTVVLADAFFDKFAERVKKEIRPGDIVLCGARKFRGGVSVVGSFCGSGEDDLRKEYESALFAAQSYSKHKASYDYGNVVFEAEARQMEQQRQLQAIIDGRYEDKEKYDQLVEMVREQNQAIADRNQRISELTEQKDQAYELGRAFGEEENARLEQENNDLRKELGDKKEQIAQMMGLYQWAREVEGSVDQMRAFETMPGSNEEVVRYFTRVFGDRLGFTERGYTEACKCRLRPEHLWEVLYTAATRLTDVFRNAQENLTDEAVMKATGFDISFHEGSMTRKQSQYMRLREDVYEGKEISVEPHIKLKSIKDEPAHQRLHFCYVPELKRVVIGYVGDHLESAATRYVGQR